MYKGNSQNGTFELIGWELVDTNLGAHSVDAAAKLLPPGAYTTFRTYDGSRILRLDQHLNRLEESVEVMGQPATLDQSAVHRALGELLSGRSFESRLRLTFSPAAQRFFIGIEPFTPLDAALYEKGVRCATVKLHRDDPHAKDTRFLAAAQAARESLGTDVHEGLMADEAGQILEGLSSNLFAILDGTLRTEGDRVLKGVTRSLVLEVAANVLPIDEHPVSLADLPRLSEAFITSVSREILPVVAIDATTLGTGTPGPLTRRLMAALAELIDKEASEPAVFPRNA
jgi:branched-chain amino acid aminotransferase